MKKIKILTIAIAALTGGSAFAQSETYNPSWYITPSVNIIHPDSRFGVDDRGEGLGLRWGKPLSQNWDLQFGPTFARATGNGLRYEQTILGADALYLFSRSRFRPFLLVGTGAERDKLTGSGNDMSKTSPYVNAGLGFQYAFTDQWSTQVDFRRVHGFIRDNNLNASNNNYLTAGLTYTFDKPAQQPVAAVAPEPAPAPVPPPPVEAAPEPRFEHYTLSATELFAFDSAQLGPSQPKLDEIAAALNKNPTIDNVVVTGYTDRLGSDKYNNRLSLARAEAVKAYLASKGIDPKRISAEGKGEANPVVECKETKRAALIKCLEPNRRVEVEQITVERRVN